MDTAIRSINYATVAVGIAKFLFTLAYSLFSMDIVVGSKLIINARSMIVNTFHISVTKLCLCAAIIVTALRLIRK